MANLVSRLSLPEAVGLSLSVVAPTIGAAFNITLVVGATGEAAPLAFLIGTVAIACVALSFMAFSHRVAHAGSAYAYITHTFGARAGFVAGWTLLLTYLGFATGFAALIGSFTGAALKGCGIDIGPLWLVVGLAALLAGWWFAYRDARLAGRLMLALELAAVIGIVGLCVAILHKVDPPPGRFLQSFHPSAQYGGWTGLGFGLVFSVLSCSGFEGAATLGEETINPRRNIPITLLATVVGSGLYFIFVSYCEVIGFGPAGLRALASSPAPLDDLAVRYVSPQLAIGLDLLAAASCFSGIIGGLTAASRVLFALGRAGLAPRLADGARDASDAGTGDLGRRGCDHGRVPRLGAVDGRRQLLQLHEHDRRAVADAHLYRGRYRRNRRVAARAARPVGRAVRARALAAAVGAVPQCLSGAGLSQQRVALSRACVGTVGLGRDAAAPRGQPCAAARLPGRQRRAIGSAPALS